MLSTSLVAQMVKNPPGMQKPQVTGSVPGWGRSPGEGNGNQLQNSCLGNLMDRRAWWVAVHRVKNNGHDRKTEHTNMHVSHTT